MTRKADAPTLILPVGPRDHTQGSESATLTRSVRRLRVPACGRAFPPSSGPEAARTKLFRVFSFPDRNHPQAQLAAELRES
jgi:hypothetical protein